MAAMKRMQFTMTIDALPQRVYELLIGPESYRDWTSTFTEGSYFEGSWQQGERIHFLSPSGDGMVAEIAEHRPGEFISIRHLGTIRQGVEDTDSAAVREWAPTFENYTFAPHGSGTRLIIDQDVPQEYETFVSQTWEKALGRLKELAESTD